jgi:hypothetical protein
LGTGATEVGLVIFGVVVEEDVLIGFFSIKLSFIT